MKTQKLNIRKMITLLIAIVMFNGNILAQGSQNPRSKIAVLNIYTVGLSINSEQCGNMVRNELEKVGVYDVMDRFDMDYLVQEKKLNVNCSSKLCLVEAGNKMGMDKMLAGTVEVLNEKIVITFKVIDVKSSTTEFSTVKEFLYLTHELGTMIRITMSEMFNREVDPALLSKLTEPFDFDNTINNPNVKRLNLTGPRMGVQVVTGEYAKIVRNSRQNGGYDGYPAFFQFGYQFESQYLNEGNFQALFEFIPMVSGLDQGMVIPSLTIMNGLRSNRNGWEFAFGPTFAISQQADGYMSEGLWHLKKEWTDTLPNPSVIIRRADSRGSATLTTAFIFAAGRTFKSGNLNIPVNVYVIPDKKGIRFGASFGFNAKN
ncbi:MAG: hypothetical protein KKA07_12590 [Bacteroidetes bacterium]|nr:hypothetical protein [Bacteroidota bacterium]MBU1719896.1 hypothetical protein [Bacteroidota bacterium]